MELGPRDGNKITLDDSKKVRINMEVGPPLCQMNGLNFIFETPVTEANGQVQISRLDLIRVLDPVLRPNFIGSDGKGRLQTVILDAAYGGGDRGSASGLGSASEYTLKIATLAVKELKNAGYKVVLTRDEDVAVAPEKRLELANAVEGNGRVHQAPFRQRGER